MSLKDIIEKNKKKSFIDDVINYEGFILEEEDIEFLNIIKARIKNDNGIRYTSEEVKKMMNNEDWFLSSKGAINR